MRRMGIILGSFALFVTIIVAVAIAWYKIKYPTYIYRYRMIVEVEDGNKVHSNSSVIEVRVNRQHSFGDAPPTVSRFRGEAVFVNLGAGHNVVALLAGGVRAEDVNYSYSLVPALFGLTFEDRDLAKLADLRGSKDVPVDRMPTFLTFKDVTDPGSAEVMRPHEFARALGPTVRLKSVTVTMTEDAVTHRIDTEIPQIIEKLREQARTMQVSQVDSPYRAKLGHFIGGL